VSIAFRREQPHTWLVDRQENPRLLPSNEAISSRRPRWDCGAQPPTIRPFRQTVGPALPFRSKTHVQDQRGTVFEVRPMIDLEGVLKLVQPGEVGQFRLVLRSWPGVTHIDDPLRAYAIDSQGRVAWGPRPNLIRLIVIDGWKGQPPDPRLLEPISGPIIARPVEPRWKLWVPKDLREPIDVAFAEMLKKRGPIQITFEDASKTPVTQGFLFIYLGGVRSAASGWRERMAQP
jgi:hypothetical protein